MVLVVGLGCRAYYPLTTAPAQDDVAATRSVAEREVLKGDSLRIERLQLGTLPVGTDTLRFDITNEGVAPRVVGVSIRTEPGLWVQGVWQRGYAVSLAAHEHRRIALAYAIRRLTPEGRLLLRVGTPTGDSTRISVERPTIDRQYLIGRGNPAARDPRANFELLRTAHFDIYAYRGSPGARDIERIASDRERAVRQVGEMLGTALRR
ncbi:MAG TPA: hypothetical protein VFZ21_16720, partial [Gemmatimonadaceae bacterium]|nr:hypothetical protein [Gemmatimonadaceae bacterium]